MFSLHRVDPLACFCPFLSPFNRDPEAIEMSVRGKDEGEVRKDGRTEEEEERGRDSAPVGLTFYKSKCPPGLRSENSPCLFSLRCSIFP